MNRSRSTASRSRTCTKWGAADGAAEVSDRLDAADGIDADGQPRARHAVVERRRVPRDAVHRDAAAGHQPRRVERRGHRTAAARATAIERKGRHIMSTQGRPTPRTDLPPAPRGYAYDPGS